MYITRVDQRKRYFSRIAQMNADLARPLKEKVIGYSKLTVRNTQNRGLTSLIFILLALLRTTNYVLATAASFTFR